jgi:two-component system, response regulator, stage 0 sporulation protein F
MDTEAMKILVVDDEPSIRLLLNEALRDEGYEVYLAEDGLEGLEIFGKISIDLVILDLRMPEMDGFEALRQIKENKSYIPVILFTSYGEYKQDFATWASDDYFVKTSDLGELFECIKYHLRGNH